MGSLYNALVGLSSVHDTEVVEGYQRYESSLTTILTAEQMEAYATYIQQAGVIRIFEDMTSDEIANLPPGLPEIAMAVMANVPITMENRRVVALLDQRGEHEATPDFNSSTENTFTENTSTKDN